MQGSTGVGGEPGVAPGGRQQDITLALPAQV